MEREPKSLRRIPQDDLAQLCMMKARFVFGLEFDMEAYSSV
jgi:hypothetical protein